MFRFKFAEVFAALFAALFQYIICFGSRNAKGKEVAKPLEFQYIICFGSSNYKCKSSVGF